ncbi:MAG: endonuclease III [Chloroflexi bacterium]|nr:endonuclease III [Chloroflexota bacterium]
MRKQAKVTHSHPTGRGIRTAPGGQRSALRGENATLSAGSPLLPAEIIRRLEPLYGPAAWQPRREPAPELVVTILSQHTSDLNAERSYEQLMRAFGSLEAVAQAPEGDIAEAIRKGGLANQKAPRIKGALRQIQAQRGSLDLSFLGDLPLEEAKAWLTAMPGVGKKTAAVVLCFSFGMPAMAVDTHVHRVAQRLGLIGPKVSADRAHEILEAMVAPEDVYRFHLYLITHGRRICKAPHPLCQRCPLASGCPTGMAQLALAQGEALPALRRGAM